MKNIRIQSILLLIITISFTTVSCEKYDKDIEGKVNIYQLVNYDTRDPGSAILSNGIVLDDTPLVEYIELLEYDSKKYSFKLTTDASARLINLMGSAFAVTIDNEVIYTGYFWASYSSATVDWVVTDIMSIEYRQKMIISLGYPGLLSEWDIPDLRNDNRILSIFARDGKLRD